MRSKSYPNFLFILFFILLTYCYYIPLEHIIYYQEQHHLFLFSQYYFHSVMESEGFLHYIATFFIQFFHYPFLGSCILATLLTLCFYFLAMTFKRIFGSHLLIGVSAIPSLYLFLKTLSPDYKIDRIILCTLISFVLFICGTILGKRKNVSSFSKKKKIISIAVCVSVGLVAFRIFYLSYNMGEYRMIMAQKYMNERNWDKVLEQTDKYLDKNKNNQLMLYFRNIALFHQGKLAHHLFDYPLQRGVTSLYFPWRSDSRESEYGHYLYEELGYINEAQRWEFESMVVWGETAPHLINLAEYNILNHKNEIALFFIRKLEQSLFYRSKAKELKTYLKNGEIPGKRNALIHINNTPAEFSNILNLGPELDYLCTNDPSNRMAFEYLLCDLLLGNNVLRFIDSLNKYPQFYPKGKKLPLLYQEALYLYALKVGEDKFSELGYPLSDNIIPRFKEYYHLYQSGNLQELKQKYSHSYWYYLHFISPYGNKIITN